MSFLIYNLSVFFAVHTTVSYQLCAFDNVMVLHWKLHPRINNSSADAQSRKRNVRHASVSVLVQVHIASVSFSVSVDSHCVFLLLVIRDYLMSLICLKSTLNNMAQGKGGMKQLTNHTRARTHAHTHTQCKCVSIMTP